MAASWEMISQTLLGEAGANGVWSRTPLGECGGLTLRHMRYSLLLSLIIHLVGQSRTNCWLPDLWERHGKIRENVFLCLGLLETSMTWCLGQFESKLAPRHCCWLIIVLIFLWVHFALPSVPKSGKNGNCVPVLFHETISGSATG